MTSIFKKQSDVANDLRGTIAAVQAELGAGNFQTAAAMMSTLTKEMGEYGINGVTSYNLQSTLAICHEAAVLGTIDVVTMQTILPLLQHIVGERPEQGSDLGNQLLAEQDPDNEYSDESTASSFNQSF